MAIKILIVDDNPALADLIYGEMAAEGIEVSLTFGEETALQVLETEKVDMIISDLLTPNIGGLMLVYKIRTNVRLECIPVVVYTVSDPSPEDAFFARSMGVDCYIRKPDTGREIMRSIRAVLKANAGRSAAKPVVFYDPSKTREIGKHLVERLDKSLGDFQKAVEQSSIVSRTDKDGTIVYVNKNFIDVSGYSREELIGGNHRMLNSGFHPRSFWADMWATILRGDYWRAEVKDRAKDGRYYWVDTFVIPSLDADGRLTGILSIRHDITRRKQAELLLERNVAELEDIRQHLEQKVEARTADLARVNEELRRSNERLTRANEALAAANEKILLASGLIQRQSETILKQKDEQLNRILESTNEVVWSYDLTGAGAHYFSRSAQRFFGKSADELSSTKLFWKDFILPECHLGVQERNRKLETKGYVECTYRLAIPGMEVRWIFDRTRLIRSADGAPERLEGMLSDITRFKNIEAELRESNDRYTAASRATNDAIWDWDIERDEQVWNHGIQTLFGYPDTRVRQVQEWREAKVHPDDIQRITTELHDAFISKRKNWMSGYRYLCSDSTYKHVLDRAYIIYKGEKPVRVIGAMQDVTEVVQYRQKLETMVEQRTHELNEALKAEKEMVEIKSRFVSIVSHEFRTPLSTISVVCGLLRKHHDQLPAQTIHEKLQNIDKQVQLMTYMLDDVLLVERASSAKIKLQPKEIVLSDFLENICLEIENSQETRHLIRVSHDFGRSTIMSDEKLLRSVLINLLTNAIKFSPKARYVDVLGSRHASNIVLRVKDYGIGIPPEDVKNLFEPFFRGRNVSAIQGTGLGLSIIKKSLDFLKGSIAINSVLGEGTEMIATLPLSA